jgi:hypothetical protein
MWRGGSLHVDPDRVLLLDTSTPAMTAGHFAHRLGEASVKWDPDVDDVAAGRDAPWSAASRHRMHREVHREMRRAVFASAMIISPGSPGQGTPNRIRESHRVQIEMNLPVRLA